MTLKVLELGLTSMVNWVLWANAIASHIPGYNAVSAVVLDIVLGPEQPLDAAPPQRRS